MIRFLSRLKNKFFLGLRNSENLTLGLSFGKSFDLLVVGFGRTTNSSSVFDSDVFDFFDSGEIMLSRYFRPDFFWFRLLARNCDKFGIFLFKLGSILPILRLTALICEQPLTSGHEHLSGFNFLMVFSNNSWFCLWRAATSVYQPKR